MGKNGKLEPHYFQAQNSWRIIDLNRKLPRINYHTTRAHCYGGIIQNVQNNPFNRKDKSDIAYASFFRLAKIHTCCSQSHMIQKLDLKIWWLEPKMPKIRCSLLEMTRICSPLRHKWLDPRVPISSGPSRIGPEGRTSTAGCRLHELVPWGQARHRMENVGKNMIIKRERERIRRRAFLFFLFWITRIS